MPKTKISEFDTNPDNNTDINSINIAEGCPPSSINNAIRQLMADLKEFQTGGAGDPFNGAVNGTVGATTPNTGAFTTLSASSTVSGTGFSNYLASPPAIGSSAANTGAFTTLSASGAASFNGGVTLGDASGDALTINSSAVSIPNGLNFDSNTFVIDATNNNVGIGTASPNNYGGYTALTINSVSTGAILDLNVVGTRTGSLFATAQETRLSSITAVPLVFYTNNTERMRITSAGNVGIGTSSPNARLSVRNTGAQVDISSSATNVTFESIDRSATTNPVDTLYYTRNGTFQWYNSSYAERMRLDSSGNLGLGVTPSVWNSSYSAYQVRNAALFGSVTATEAAISANTVIGPSSTTYISTGAASIYQQVTGQHRWYTAPSGTQGNAITFTQAMTLDASGNLGIGTSSPTYNLDVSATSPTVRAVSSSGTGSVSYRIDNTGGNTQLFRDSSTGGSFSGVAYAAGIFNSGAYPFILFTNSTERMRIDSSGNLLVGRTSNSGNGGIFQVTAIGSNTSVADFRINASSGSQNAIDIANVANAAYVAERFWVNGYNGSLVGTISCTTTATAYNTSSDYRLKENIVPMTGALAKVQALKPCTYTWKSNGEQGEGFIAHELAEVVPQAVTGEKDAVDVDGKPIYQGIDTSFLVATLTAAIQEQQTIINDLKARIETLESK